MGVVVQHHALAVLIPGKGRVLTVQDTGWVPEPVWTSEENLARTRIRFPDLPARGKSLYRLRYFKVIFIDYKKKKSLEHLIRLGFMAIAPTSRTVDICKKMDPNRVCLTSMTFVHKLIIAVLMTIGMAEVMSYIFKICSCCIEIIRFFARN